MLKGIKAIPELPIAIPTYLATAGNLTCWIAEIDQKSDLLSTEACRKELLCQPSSAAAIQDLQLLFP